MATEFKLPELGENIESGDLVRLMIKPGASINEGEPVMELETDKAVVEVPSSVSGTIGEVRVKEGDKVILFPICQLKVAELFLVEVPRIFGRRPARNFFTRVSRLAPGQNVARIVKVHYLFEALEVAVVHVGLHEVGRRTHVDVAQRGYLELGVEFGSEPDPPRIRIQLAAIALQRAEK